jgi:tetratricopeptide (TPR) repeat protein
LSPAPTTPESPREAELRLDRAVQANPRDAAAWHQLGLVRQNLAKHGEAVQALTRASTLDPRVARYHHDLGSALIEDGKADRAITSFRRALRIDDTLAEAHNDLGTAYYDKGWYAEAEGCFRRAIALKADHGIAHANLGAALRAQGRLTEGRRQFQRALVLKLRGLLPRFLQWNVGEAPSPVAAASTGAADGVLRELSAALLAGQLEQSRAIAARAEKEFPEHPDVLFLSSTVLEEAGDVAQALDRIDKAIILKPERAEYYVARARLHNSAGRLDDALRDAQKGLALDPGSADVHAALAAAYRSAQRYDLAEEAARKALALEPESHAAHGNLSAVLWAQGHLEPALVHGREALRLAPRSLHYQVNLAVILKDAGQLEEASLLYRDAIPRVPRHAGILLNMGTLALECEGDQEAARRWYRRSDALGKDPRTTLSLAIVDLLEGRYEEAWAMYDERKRVGNHVERHAPFERFKQWKGETLRQETLLVYGEQGLGDEIMFASMLGELQARAPRIRLLCDDRLRTLFARSFPETETVGLKVGKPMLLLTSDPDQVVALGSLGRHFRRTAADFPAHRGYLLPDAEKVAAWRARLDALGAVRKIGISWSGGTMGTGLARRSLSLAQLRPLLELPDITWVSLQYGSAAEDAAAFTRETGIALQVFPGVTDDIDDLASLVQALDLVVSVCNTTVHTAGAIGKEVLVMAPYLPEWRYGMRGERMAWYPSARVFRQAKHGHWESVIAQVKERLQR